MPRRTARPLPIRTIELTTSTKACPSCGESVPLAGVLCIACGYDFRTGKRLSTTIDTGSDDD